MKTKLTLLLVILNLFQYLTVNAQAPGATCITAAPIGGTGNVPGCTGAQTIADFTLEAGTPAFTCGGTFRREGWYTFVAPGGQAITVEATTTTVTADLEIQVISGSCGAGTEIACVNNAPPGNSQLEAASLGVLAAGTYYIRILNVGAAISMVNTNLCVYYTPSNDDCAGAIALTTNSTCVMTSGDVLGATASGLPAACGGTANDDVWYSFVASSVNHIITIAGSTGFDAAFELYSTCGGTSLGCVNATGQGGSEANVFTGLTIGQAYWVRVYDFTGNPSTTAFTICVQTPLLAYATASLPTCTGLCDGTAYGYVAMGTGTGPFGYSWAGPSGYTATTDSISNLCVGTYTLTVTDSSNMNTTTATCTYLSAPVATFSYIPNVYCQSGGNAYPIFTGGGVAGTFSAVPAGLVFLNVSTGVVGVSLCAPGTYTVTNTIAASGSCGVITASSPITIQAAPVATFSYIGTPYCQGGTDPSPTFTGGAQAGTFSSTPGLVFVSTATGQVSLAASTIGTYTVTNTIAASGGCGAITSTAIITITNQTVATFNYPSNPYCPAGNASPVFTGGGVAGTFTAAPVGLMINAATGVVNTATSVPGTYTVTNSVAASGSCAASSATATITITAGTAPVGSASNITICNGDPVNIPLNSTIGGSTFTWTSYVTFGSVIGNNDCSSGCGTAITDILSNLLNVHGTVEYSVTPMVPAGCSGSPFLVDVDIAGTPAQTTITGPATICALNSAVYSVPSVPEATTYTWTVPSLMNITSGQGTTSLHVSIAPGNAAGYVTCSADNSCGSGAIDSFAVAINGSYVNLGPDVTLPCGAAIYNSFTTPVVGATFYSWITSSNMTISSGQGTDSITIQIPAQSGGLFTNFIICTATGTLTCPTYTSDTMYLNIGTQAINFNIMADSTNAYNYTMFNATYGSGLSYSWDFGDGSAVSTLMSPSHTYSTTGTYAVCLTATNGTCAGTVCDSVVVTGILNSCNALFNVAHDTASGNPNAYTVTNLSYGNNLSYLWSFGDTATSTAVHPTHTYANIGPYQLCLTINDGAGCVQTYCDSLFAVDSLHTHLQPISIIVVGNNPGTTVGVHESVTNNEVTIAPNPFTEQTTITFPEEHTSAGSATHTIIVTDVLGNTIQQLTTSNKQLTLDMTGVAKGIYFVRITSTGSATNVVNRKIVVE